MTGALETPPEEQSQGLGTGESFTFSKPPAVDAPAGEAVSYSERDESLAQAPDFSGSLAPAEIALAPGQDEDSIIGEDTGSGSVELVIEREAPEPAEAQAQPPAAEEADESEVTASAPELRVTAERMDEAGDESEAPGEKEAAPSGEESEDTMGLAERPEASAPEALALENSASDFESRALDEVEQALKGVEPAAPDAAEAEIVAALAREIAPAAAAPADEASGLDAWQEAELLLRAAEAADQERETAGPVTADPGQDSASPVGELDPLDIPGEATAAAMRRIMEPEGERTDGSGASVEAEAPTAEAAAPEVEAPSPAAPEPDSSEVSAGASFEESRLDKFFEQSADDVASGCQAEADEESQIEIAPRGVADHGAPLPLELPLGAAGASSGERGNMETGRGIRAVRGRRAKKAARPGAWLMNLRRAGAGLFDVAVWAALGLALYKGAVLANGQALHGSAWEWLSLVAFPLMIMSGILALVYGSLFGSITGRTPGMMIFGLKLAAVDGQKPALARSFVRTGVFILSLVPMGAGLLFALFGDKGALHDRLSGIRVERV